MNNPKASYSESPNKKTVITVIAMTMEIPEQATGNLLVKILM